MSKRVRLDYLDIAKAITIFLVIIGHVPDNSMTPMFRLVLYTFHMPLFFLVSGVTVRRHRHEYNKEHWLKFFQKNIVALVIPYFIWAIIYGSLDYNKLPLILYASWAKLSECGTLTSLWFLPCLFVARTLMELVMMLSTHFDKINRHVFAFVASGVAFLIGFTLPSIEGGYPWCIDSAFTALGFILLGYSFKEILVNKSQKFLLGHLIAYTVIFVGYTLYKGDALPYIRMFDNDINDVVTFFVLGLSGCGIILSLSRIIAKLWEKSESKLEDLVLWIGKSTIGIFLIHKPFLQEVVMPIIIKFGFTYDDFLGAFIGAVITLIYSCLMIKIIERFIPQLFGKFNNHKTVIIVDEIEDK